MKDKDHKVPISAIQEQLEASSATSRNQSIIVDYQKY
jgi:hypothetical protein